MNCLVIQASANDLYAPRTDWSSFTGGKHNISGFIFRDLDRDGVYGVDDQPMEDIATKVVPPVGKEKIIWSNSNGFANFSMSVKDKRALIKDQGIYQFEVLIPPGWVSTTDNVVQEKSIAIVPGAIADMALSPPFTAVGIAPELSISGYAANELSEITEILATSDDGTKSSGTVDSARRFRIPVNPGKWRVSLVNKDGSKTYSNDIDVDHAPVQLSDNFFYSEPGLAESDSKTVNFENITQKNIREMPNGVADLNWWNVVALKQAPGYINNSVSGYYVGYNSSGHPAQVSNTRPFDFIGGYFGVAHKRANGETLKLSGWKNGVQKFSDEIVLSNLGPVWFQANYQDIDRLDLATEHYWQFVMDDVKFNVD